MDRMAEGAGWREFVYRAFEGMWDECTIREALRRAKEGKEVESGRGGVWGSGVGHTLTCPSRRTKAQVWCTWTGGVLTIT